jgi:uncharacterized protein with GYD domain
MVTIKELLQNVLEAGEVFGSNGVKIIRLVFTLGRCDVVCPDGDSG